MKLINLAILFLMLFALSGCTSTGGPKDGEIDGSGDVVEDNSADSSGIEDASASGSDFGDGSEAQVIVGEGNDSQNQYLGDELNDPNSPLSNRVVYFEYDSSEVRPQDLVTLEAHAAYLAENPNVTVRLVGHTDERGSREYNLALGERRALSIRQILMLQGANINQFQVTSFGEERPDIDGEGEGVWQQNRRVELIY